MKMNEVVHIGHFDLDGVTSTILVKKIWNVIKSYNQGYNKIRQNLEKSVNEYPDIKTIVISDLNIIDEDFQYIMEHYDQIYLFDHHESTEELLKYKSKNIYIDYTNKLSASAILYKHYVRIHGLDKNLSALVKYTNIYDLWKSDKKDFDIGVKLNDLFWDINFWNFETRFENGFDGFTDNELELLENIHKKREYSVFNECIIEEAKSGNTIVFVNESSTINFIPYYYKDEDCGDIFYIISEKQDSLNISLRLKNNENKEKYNFNDIVRELENNDLVMSCGGHKHAAGITLIDNVKLNEVVEFLHNDVDPLFMEI